MQEESEVFQEDFAEDQTLTVQTHLMMESTPPQDNRVDVILDMSPLSSEKHAEVR